MRRYSEAVKADVRRRMSPPHRQSVARISEELGIHVVTLYNWRKAWRLHGTVLPASEKEPEGWSALVVGHHLSAHHRSRDLALPLSGGRCLEPQGGGLGCG